MLEYNGLREMAVFDHFCTWTKGTMGEIFYEEYLPGAARTECAPYLPKPMHYDAGSNWRRPRGRDGQKSLQNPSRNLYQ
jgi:hypothetical protein